MTHGAKDSGAQRVGDVTCGTEHLCADCAGECCGIPASIQALKDMGAFLQTLKRFRVSTELTGERVLADGQKLQHTGDGRCRRRASEQDPRPDA